MTDERLFERLAAHAGPADVDPGFEDRLYALLQQEMGRSGRSSRPVLLLAAALAAILVISAAVAVGSGLIELPWLDESPTPAPSASASGASPTPDQTAAAAWAATGPMSEARVGHTATLLDDGNVLVTGGTSTGPSLATAELYSPSTGSWSATGSMVEARTYHTATLLPDGRVLVTGGIGTPTSEFFANILASAELYDPETGQWTATSPMLGVRVSHTATLLRQGTVLVAGGGSSSDGDGGPLASAELYDPNTGSWTPTGSMVGAGPGWTATLLANGGVLMTGGFLTAEQYDPGRGIWTATGPMLGARVGHTATLLPNGMVLVAGGMAGTGALVGVELYDPDTAQWNVTGTMIEARLSHGATLLADGRVLVAGGVNSVIDGGVASGSAELYDPVSGSWTATASMPEARTGFSMTLLPDGTVLVAGGTSVGTESLASAELYDLGSGN